MNNITTITIYDYATKQNVSISVTQEVHDAYCRTAWNIKKNEQKHNKHTVPLSCVDYAVDKVDKEPIDTSFDVEDIIIAKLRAAAVREAISRLSEIDQKIIEGLFYEDITETELAKRLSISQVAVCKRKKKILKSLKKILSKWL